MGRTRDVSKILTSNTSILSLASASTTYATKVSTGLNLINTTSFSAQTTISINNVFNADYFAYKIIVYKDTVSTTNSLSFRLRASGVDLSSNTYNLVYNAVKSDNVVQTGFGTSTSVSIGGDAIATGMALTFDLTNPFRTVGKKNVHTYHSWSLASGLNSGLVNAWYIDNTTSYDGLSLIASTGTITGNVSVYGYNK
jgi:hypothetical protein